MGSTIGKIRAIGVVGQDIRLSLAPDLEEALVSVEVTGGEASLVLTRPLDKEAVLGPANLIVGVICEKIGTNDTGFTIPINIRAVKKRNLCLILSFVIVWSVYTSRFVILTLHELLCGWKTL